MQIRNFISNEENTMNHFSSSSVMGFVDQILNPKYKNTNYEMLLDIFCTEVIMQKWSKKLTGNIRSDKTSLKEEIRLLFQNRSSDFTAAYYFDPNTRQTRLAAFDNLKIFHLVLAATLDNEVYEEFECGLTDEEYKINRISRIYTLFKSLFGGYKTGVNGRCNQGVRHELVGCLNGVYPKSKGEYWYFIEDVRAAIETQVSDYLGSCVKTNLSSMVVSHESEAVTLSLKDFLLFDQYRVDGLFSHGIPKLISVLQKVVNQRLAVWAEGCFIDPDEILEQISGGEINDVIIGALVSAMDKVALFKAWGQLRLCAEMPNFCGKWLLSIENCRQMINVVVSWINNQTLSNIDKLFEDGISDDFVLRLSALEELITVGRELDALQSLGLVDLGVLNDKLNKLPEVTSMATFDAIQPELFTQLLLDVKQVFYNIDSEKVLWQLIYLKQQAESDLEGFIGAFKKIVATKKIAGLTGSNIASLLDFLSKPQGNLDVFTWSVVSANCGITYYLINSAIKEKRTATSQATKPLLLNQLPINSALIIAIDNARIEIAMQVLAILEPYSEMFKAALIQQNKGGENCLISAADKNYYEIVNRILDLLDNPSLCDSGTFKTLLSQQDESGQNCLMSVVADKDHPEIARRVLNMLNTIASSDYNFLKTVLTQQDRDGWNFLMYAINNNCSKITNQIFSMLTNRSLNSFEILKALLTQQDGSGQNCLMSAIFDKECPEISNQILDVLSDTSLIDPETLKTVLTTQDEDGRNCLMLAINDATFKTVNRIIELIFSALSHNPETLKAVLTKQDEDGRNCLMLAASKDRPEIISRIFGMLCDTLSNNFGIFEAMLDQENWEGQSCRSIIEDKFGRMDSHAAGCSMR